MSFSVSMDSEFPACADKQDTIGDAHETSENVPVLPKSLGKVKRKNKIDLMYHRRRTAFIMSNMDAFLAMEPDLETCIVCQGRHSILQSVSQDPNCKCQAHTDCLETFRRDDKFKFRCSHCAPKSEEVESLGYERSVPPKKRSRDSLFTLPTELMYLEEDEEAPPPAKKSPKTKICATPTMSPDGVKSFCTKPKNHLGNC